MPEDFLRHDFGLEDGRGRNFEHGVGCIDFVDLGCSRVDGCGCSRVVRGGLVVWSQEVLWFVSGIVVWKAGGRVVVAAVAEGEFVEERKGVEVGVGLAL